MRAGNPFAYSPTPAAPVYGPRTPKGALTIKKIDEAMQKGTSHCIPELIELIQAISVQGQNIQVMDLSELVEKHVGVMSRIISAAASIGFNPNRMEITTIAHAIQVIGFDRIRSLVTTLLLVRSAQDAEQARDQKEAAISAVTAGLQAQLVAQKRKLVDPEQAFVAASLRQLGKLLLSTYAKNEYKAALELAETKKIPVKQAFQETFGLTPVELTKVVLTKAKFPESMLQTLEEPENMPKRKKRGEENKISLMDVAVFAEKLCDLTMNRKLPQESFPQKARSLCANYPEDMDFMESEMMELLGEVAENLGNFTESMGFGSIANDAVQMCRHRQGKADMPPLRTAAFPDGQPAAPEGEAAPAPEGAVADASAPATETPAPVAEPEPALAVTPAAPEEPAAPAKAPEPVVAANEKVERVVIEIGMAELKEGLVTLTNFLSDPPSDIGILYAEAMEVIRYGFSAPECILLSLDNDRVNFTASHGVGRVFSRVRGRRAMKTGERTALGVSALRRENVVIHDTSDPKTKAYLPEWGTLENGWGAFVSIPFHDGTNCFGMMLVAWPKPCHLTLTADQTKILRSIVSMVSAAKKMVA